MNSTGECVLEGYTWGKRGSKQCDGTKKICDWCNRIVCCRHMEFIFPIDDIILHSCYECVANEEKIVVNGEIISPSTHLSLSLVEFCKLHYCLTTKRAL